MESETEHRGVGPGDAVYRDATPEDTPFLRQMTYEAAFWRDDRQRPDIERALANADIARYVPRFGGEGDITVVTERDGLLVGAGWSRFFPAERPGYGFVAADVPELRSRSARRHAVGGSRRSFCARSSHERPIGASAASA